eukprot:m.118087 g.118087  ORF g.118087 m.118087 type:complete len:53 (+) comp15443_c0_seq4:627-785(+)
MTQQPQLIPSPVSQAQELEQPGSIDCRVPDPEKQGQSRSPVELKFGAWETWC